MQRNPDAVAKAVDELRAQFPDRVQTSPSLREQHGHTTTFLSNQPPDAVVFPANTDEVADIVRICARHRTPIIPFGAGTSLEGQVNAPMGGICLDFRDMAAVLAVHQEDMDCVVQPGITRRALNDHLRDTGLFFPVDPGADATLGGMASTRASGTTAVRYGTMRDAVISLTAVMPNGEIVTTGKRARKSSAGYDLAHLLVGSEGTLGIITELTVRLQGIAAATSAAVCQFPTVKAACDAVIATAQMGIPMARIELLDAANVRCVNAYSDLSLPEEPLLLLEFHGSEASVAEQASEFQLVAEEFGASGFSWSANAEERNRLWRARHDAYWAFIAASKYKKALATDVCVPISALAECVEAARLEADAMGLDTAMLGHVGDGNFHVLAAYDEQDTDQHGRIDRYIGWLAQLAVDHEGTCTGEHGIGQGKRGYLANELGWPAVQVMRAIKTALDPLGIMNPGKILEPDNSGRPSK